MSNGNIILYMKIKKLTTNSPHFGVICNQQNPII